MITVVLILLLFALCQLIFYADNPNLIFSPGFSGESQNPQSQRNFVAVTVHLLLLFICCYRLFAVTVYLLLVVISFPELISSKL